MIDIFDASQFMFAPVYGTDRSVNGGDRYVFFQTWGRTGFDVSAAERLRLARRLGPYLTLMLIFFTVFIKVDDLIALHLGVSRLLVNAGAIVAFLLLVVTGGSVIRRTVLGARARTEAYIPHTQRCGAEQSGKQLLKRVVSFGLIFVGVNIAAAALLAGNYADGLLGLIILGAALVHEAWRFRRAFGEARP